MYIVHFILHSETEGIKELTIAKKLRDLNGQNRGKKETEIKQIFPRTPEIKSNLGFS